MKLVFIHGWGLDASSWNAIAGNLSEFQQQKIDLGFFGTTRESYDDIPALLIGHSLGFVHGIAQRHNWNGWIAINSFPRFITTPSKPGCSSATGLRDMRMRVEANAGKTLRDFHGFIGAATPQGKPNTEKLRDALNELRDCDVTDTLKTLNAPGLVLASRNDPLVPFATSESLAVGHDIQWNETGGHVLPQSDPMWCAGMIREFVKQHARINA